MSKVFENGRVHGGFSEYRLTEIILRVSRKCAACVEIVSQFPGVLTKHRILSLLKREQLIILDPIC
jgi:hypothetical protein